jgi:hypothetical protein
VPPTVTEDPESQTVASGETATFTAAASGNPAPTVQWQVSTGGGPFEDVPGETATTLSFATSDGMDQNAYQAVFTNPGGPAVTGAATLTVTSEVVSSPPSEPQDVVAKQTGRHQITVTWSDPASAGSSPVTGYDVGYGTTNWGNGGPVSATTFSAVFDDLPYGTYTASVSAFNAAGTGPRVQVPVTVTRPAPAVRAAPAKRTRAEARQLARTGSPLGTHLELAVFTLALGVALVVGSRRRQQASAR